MITNVRKDIAATIRSKRPDARILLFGSRARGDAHPGSDWDVIVIVNDEHITPSVFASIDNPLYELALDNNIEINPIIYTTAQWNKQHPTLFKHNIETDAIEL